MKTWKILSLLLLFACATVYARNNAIPLLYPSISPISAAPGAAGFTLTVNGTGFATGAVLNWNGSARTTTVISSSSLQATINASDVAHAGTAALTVVNPAPGGGTSNVIYFPVRHAAVSVAFGPESGISPPVGPSAMGDFTGDGLLDFVVAQATSSGGASILLYRGLGNGTFAAPVTTTISLPIYGLATGDFNNDAKLDLVASTSIGAFNVNGVVLLNNGGGHFIQKTPFAGGDDGWVIGVADVNGDGILDVLFVGEAQGSGAVQVCLGLGNGNFTLATQLNMNNYSAYGTVGDFNNDGKLDIAVPDFYQVDIFLGNGDGTFQPFVAYPTACQAGGIATADLNGDGNLDIAFGGLCVLLGNGDGTFTAGNVYGNGEGPVAVADFNGDGKLDVVTAGEPFQVYLGNGDGTFQNAISTGGALFPGAQMYFGDFNRDGMLDLMGTTNANVQVGLQTTLNVSTASLNFGSHTVGSSSAPQTVTLTNVGSTSIPISGIALGGLDSGDFIEHNNCGAGLHAGTSCMVTLEFKPTAKGSRNATLTITYTGIDSPQVVTLSGYGL